MKALYNNYAMQSVLLLVFLLLSKQFVINLWLSRFDKFLFHTFEIFLSETFYRYFILLYLTTLRLSRNNYDLIKNLIV